MSRLAIAFVLALAANAANAQDTRSEQSRTPAVAGASGTRPFLFDGRMRGDGVRQGALADDHHPNAGAIVVPPKASQPGRERSAYIAHARCAHCAECDLLLVGCHVLATRAPLDQQI